MMPPQFWLIISKSGRGIDLVAVDRLPVFLTAQHGEIVLHPNQKNIFTWAKRLSAGKFKLLEKSLVGSKTDSVQINLTGVIHSAESKNNIFL
jgi:hypothetical protein